jgi:selenocysteine-specific elongation factor
VRLKPDVLYPADHFARIRGAVIAGARSNGSTSIAEVREELGLSRKYSQAILEHLDRTGRTVRRGDEHLPRPSLPNP